MKFVSLLSRTFVFAFLFSACAHSPSSTTPTSGNLANTHHSVDACMAYEGKPLPKNFKDFDTAKTGRITKEEFLCQIIKYFDAFNQNHDSYLSGREILALHKASGRAEENGDNKVSIVEFMETASGAFDAFDKDKDGTLSESEFKAGLKAIK